MASSSSTLSTPPTSISYAPEFGRLYKACGHLEPLEFDSEDRLVVFQWSGLCSHCVRSAIYKYAIHLGTRPEGTPETVIFLGLLSQKLEDLMEDRLPEFIPDNLEEEKFLDAFCDICQSIDHEFIDTTNDILRDNFSGDKEVALMHLSMYTQPEAFHPEEGRKIDIFLGQDRLQSTAEEFEFQPLLDSHAAKPEVFLVLPGGEKIRVVQGPAMKSLLPSDSSSGGSGANTPTSSTSSDGGDPLQVHRGLGGGFTTISPFHHTLTPPGSDDAPKSEDSE